MHALAMAVIVVVAFYYSDLYAIDQTLSLHELSHRFVAGLGIACIVIGVGLLIAFVPKLVRYIRAQAPRRAPSGAS